MNSYIPMPLPSQGWALYIIIYRFLTSCKTCQYNQRTGQHETQSCILAPLLILRFSQCAPTATQRCTSLAVLLRWSVWECCFIILGLLSFRAIPDCNVTVMWKQVFCFCLPSAFSFFTWIPFSWPGVDYVCFPSLCVWHEQMFVCLTVEHGQRAFLRSHCCLLISPWAPSPFSLSNRISWSIHPPILSWYRILETNWVSMYSTWQHVEHIYSAQDNTTR